MLTLRVKIYDPAHVVTEVSTPHSYAVVKCLDDLKPTSHIFLPPGCRCADVSRSCNICLPSNKCLAREKRYRMSPGDDVHYGSYGYKIPSETRLINDREGDSLE